MSFLSKHLIDDVPPSLEACETCCVGNCPQSDWKKCPRRLATEAEVEAEATSQEASLLIVRGDPLP